MQEKPAEALYDFLYRDSSRITSYYAQLFGGHLTAMERSDALKKGKDSGGSLSIPTFVTGSARFVDEVQSSTKEVINPHDLIASDVIKRLHEDGRVSDHVSGAKHGSVVLVHGTLLFIDRSMLEIGCVAMESVVKEEKGKKAKGDKKLIESYDGITAMLARLAIPSGFALYNGSQPVIAGTVKEAGMEEPISTYYFKHGSSGLADVYCLGIKEVGNSIPDPPFPLTKKSLMAVGGEAAKHLSGILLPEHSIRVTPIALFRKF